MTVTTVLMLLFVSLVTTYSGQLKHHPSPSSDHCLPQCPSLLHYNSSTHSCQCFYYVLHPKHIICKGNDSFILGIYILTFDSKRNVVTAYESRSYRFYHGTNTTKDGYRLLPTHMSELNDYMCGPLNRKGSYLCSDCIDGFGPSMSIIEHPNDCYKCRNNWHGVILYIIIVLLPVTVVYLIILIFQIRITSAPIPCFIMYSQLISIVLSNHWGKDYDEVTFIMFTETGDLRTVTRLILVFYGIFNLDSLSHVVPPFCVTSYLRLYHRAILGYLIPLYPMLLIAITWICIELHDRNIRVIVFLWRPFRRCFLRLRRGWDIRNDLIDVFASFFLLSYVKMLFQFNLMTNRIFSFTYSLTTDYSYDTYVLSTDITITQSDAKYVIGAVSAGLISIILNLLPALLLVLYPFRFFRKLLSKLRLDKISLMIFMEKFHCCYRDGLDEQKDMRCFSVMYFILEILLGVAVMLIYSILRFDIWFIRGTLFLITAILIALCRPYKKMYMNVCDTLLLSHTAVICYLLSIYRQIKEFVLSIQILIIFPLIVLTFVILFKLLHNIYSSQFFGSKWRSLTRLVTAVRSDGGITMRDNNSVSMYGAIDNS